MLCLTTSIFSADAFAQPLSERDWDILRVMKIMFFRIIAFHYYSAIRGATRLLSATLQTANTQRQRCQKRIQQRDDIQQHDVQHNLKRNNEQR